MNTELVQLLESYNQRAQQVLSASSSSAPLSGKREEPEQQQQQQQQQHLPLTLPSTSSSSTSSSSSSPCSSGPPSPFCSSPEEKLLQRYDQYEQEVIVSCSQTPRNLRSRAVASELVEGNQMLFSPRMSFQRDLISRFHGVEEQVTAQTNRVSLRSRASPLELKAFSAKLWPLQTEGFLASRPSVSVRSSVLESKKVKEHSKRKKEDCCIFHSAAFTAFRGSLGDEITIRHLLERQQKLRRNRRRSSPSPPSSSSTATASSSSLFTFDPLSPAYSPSLGPWSIDQLALPEIALDPPLACVQECRG